MLISQQVRRLSACSRRDLADLRYLNSLWEIFETASDLEFGGAIDEVEVLCAVIQSHESPRSTGPLDSISRDGDRRRYGVDKPSTLKQTVYPLLANELERFLVQFLSEVAYGKFAEKVVVHFELLHLPFSYVPISL
jgi:hypothetical protein